VMHTKEHLAALIPSGAALILNTVRWANEIRPTDELKLPAEGKAGATLKPAELKMAAQLIRDMTGKWKAGDYSETFSAAIQKLVAQKIKAGDTKTVTPLEEAPSESTASNVIDLTELLAKSLAKRKPGATAVSAVENKEGGKGVLAKKAPAKRPVRKRA
jgi:DNA end-binding protein Ku